jgi:hypothetical protein
MHEYGRRASSHCELRSATEAADYVPAYLMYAQLLVREDRADDAKQILTAGIAAADKKGDQHAVAEMEALLADIS